MQKLRLSDGTFYPKIPTICECNKCNEVCWNGNRYIKGHVHIGKLRPDISKLMKENNPMWIPEVVEMHSGDNNCMKRPDVVAKFMGDLNSSKRPEVKAKLINVWKDPKARERASKANSDSWTPERRNEYSKRMIKDNIMYNEEVRAKHLESVNTKEYKDKMSVSTKKSWKTKPKMKNCGKNSHMFGKPPHHGKVYTHISPFQGEIKLNGSYEHKYALYLDSNSVKWYYEPKYFDLILNEKETSYTPDFYIPSQDKYIEIKGYWRDDSKEKYELFLKTYPEIKIKLLMLEDLKELGIKL